MKQTNSHGKGSRRMPGRDGGKHRSKRDKWRRYVPDSVDEFELEDPVEQITVEFLPDASNDRLTKLNELLREAEIPYSIKGKGQEAVMGINFLVKYAVKVSKKHYDAFVQITEVAKN